MPAYRVDADTQQFGDVLACQSFVDESQNPRLSCRQNVLIVLLLRLYGVAVGGIDDDTFGGEVNGQRGVQAEGKA